jgi:hypothetical protein
MFSDVSSGPGVPRREVIELLFTDSFLQSMLKEAAQDVTLAN